jgi:dTDP-4-dehydrorhamnose 3,5-epimerase
MNFQKTKLAGVFKIQLERRSDERGFFARTWCKDEFASHGLNASLVQSSISFNAKKGTLRGMHYQAAPFAETKVIRCTQGALYDVVIDLRPDSLTFKQWIAAELSAENRDMLYVPEGCAHGFLTLADKTEILYQMSQVYTAESARGVRWNDPAFAIDWPAKVQVIADRDRAYPDFRANQ